MIAVSTLRPTLVNPAAACLSALLFVSVVQAGPRKPATPKVTPGLDLTEAEKLQAVQAANPTVASTEVPALAARWEKAWSRAQTMGLLKTADARERSERSRREVLGKALLDTMPGHIVTEDQVRTAFLNQGEERKVSHLLCRTEEEAATARKRILAGEAFDVVAAECSIDPSAVKNRGDLGWIRRSQMVKAFGDPVFEAPVEALVGPLQTEYGWHVAKVSAARTPKAEDFPAVRDAWMRQMTEALAAQKRESALAELRKRHPLKADLKVLGSDRTTELKAGDEKIAAGRVAGVTISLRDTKLYLAESLKAVGQSHSLGAATKASFMEGLADSIRLAAAARKQGLDRRPAVRGALWAAQRQQAYALFSEAYLATAKVADSDLKAHHEGHPDRFRQVGALRLLVLVAESEERVNEALARIQSGLNWREAVARYGDAEVANRPEPEWIEVASLQTLVPPTLMKPLLAGALNQPVGPMLGPDGYMIFNVLERRPGPVMPLAECQDAVRADYLKDHGQALVDRSLED